MYQRCLIVISALNVKYIRIFVSLLYCSSIYTCCPFFMYTDVLVKIKVKSILTVCLFIALKNVYMNLTQVSNLSGLKME